MKYIRTKEGVYEVVGFDEECIIPSTLIKAKDNYGKERITHCCKGDIINQSKNLEELCDEFVIDNPNSWNSSKKPFVYENGRQKLFEERKIKFRNEHNIIVYGAIWTDKGLIYVAKMNEDGELELI